MRRPRTATILRWLSTLACAVLLAMLALSLRWSAYVWRAGPASGLTVLCTRGELDIQHLPFGISLGARTRWGLNVTPQDESARWKCGWKPKWSSDAPGTAAVLPLWIPCLGIIPTALWWWRDLRTARRRRTGACKSCGYDRSGLMSPTSPCPECGAVPTGA